MTEEKKILSPRENFEDPLETGMTIDAILQLEATADVFTLTGRESFKISYGEITKAVNALMDYARLLELACTQWNLTGYHKAVYELHAENLRKIAGKMQDGIGYNYEALLRKCEKRKMRKGNDDVGEDALVLTVKSHLNASDPKSADKENGGKAK